MQTRLAEYLDGKGRQPGVKVYYLKPLCVEVEDKLIFTQHADIVEAIEKIKSDVLSEFRRNYLSIRPQIARQEALKSSASSSACIDENGNCSQAGGLPCQAGI